MEKSFKEFYAGKKVLITGHTGFKGSWLTMWLRELGAEVVGYSLDPPSSPNAFEICRLHERVTDIRADIRDYDQLVEVFREHQPEIVFHMAAQALVRHSYAVPRDTFDTNVQGTVNVLDAVRLTDSVRVIVNITSDKCYENREQVWGYKESDPMGGDDPYSASKGAAEIVFRAYLRSFFRHRDELGSVSARAGNVIGGGDWGMDRIVPDSIQSLAAGKPIKVRSPMAIRPWQHVLEPLSGYLWLGARCSDDAERFAGGWNFGPADSAARCVSDLVRAIIRKWESGEWVDVSESNDHRIHEAGWLRLSTDKAQAVLPWKAVLEFEETIGLTVSWYRYHYEFPETNMYQYSVHQIRKYTSLASQRGETWAV